MLEIADRRRDEARSSRLPREIQTWLLPGAPPQIPGISVAYATRPANTVAGDYYDVFPRPGKTAEENPRNVCRRRRRRQEQFPPPMLMATFQASLKTLSTAQVALSELVANMNKYAARTAREDYASPTAFLAEYDVARRIFTYINAVVNNNPILRRSSGLIERLDVGGLPIRHSAGSQV